MKICITGGLGYIGRHLIENLCKKGHDVVVIDKNDYIEDNLVSFFESRYSNFTFVHADIFDIDLNEIYREYVIESVVHLASSTDTRSNDNHRKNVYGLAMEAYNQACCAGVKTFVNASSAVVYAYRNDNIPTEYGINKYFAETTMLTKRNYFAEVSNLYNLRLFNPYGHSNIIPYSKHKKGLWFNAVKAHREDTVLELRSKTLDQHGTCVRDWINIFDTVETFARFATKPTNEFIDKPYWDVGTGQGTSSFIFISHFITIEDINLDITYVDENPLDSYYSVSDPIDTNKYINFRSSVGPKLYSNSYLNGVYVS